MTRDVLQKKQVFKTIPFNVEKVSFTNESHPYHRLLCPNWVNILPITKNKKAVMIRQFRVGVLKEVLETPGGVVDQKDSDPASTALRELEEETGYKPEKLIFLGSMCSNPAIINNSISFFVGLDCELVTNRTRFPDKDEQIETVLTSLSDLEELVAAGKVDHCLSSLCILLAKKYIAQSLI